MIFKKIKANIKAYTNPLEHKETYYEEKVFLFSK